MTDRDQWVHFDGAKLITGESVPEFGERLKPDLDFIAALYPRLKSLIWTSSNRPSAFAPALFAFSQRRRVETLKISALLPQEGWAVLSMVPVIDQLREPLAGSWDPRAPVSNWPRMLFDAVDDIVQALWLLRAGSTIPAALLTRVLLERWTHNVAHYHSLQQQPSELDEHYISRVWQTYAPHGVSAHVGSWWATLSEIAHGHSTAGRLGQEIVGGVSAEPKENANIHKGICQVLELCLMQIRGGLSMIVSDAGQPQYLIALRADPPPTPILAEPFDLGIAYYELDYYKAHSMHSEQWTQLAAIYRKLVKDPANGLTKSTNNVMTVEAFLERRGRAIERSREAFSVERELLKEEFDPGSLAARLFRQASFAELARLMADGESEEDAALLAAAQCLDSATHFWLEDSDHSMAFMRVVLEQTARLRVHRLKKTRAERMEIRGDASASRWLEAAGWKRLSALLRAVNEFSHLGRNTRREGARELLLLVQGEDPVMERSRGAALDAIAYLFAFELYARLLTISADAARRFTDSVTLMDEPDYLGIVEEYFSRAHNHRNFDFGEPDFE